MRNEDKGQAAAIEAFGIQSPSKVVRALGAGLADGFLRGIEDWEGGRRITAQRKRRKAHVRRWRRK